MIALMAGLLAGRLARNLRALRADTGLSQEQVAEILGIHRTYYSDLEIGRRNPTLKTVEKLANLLGVSAFDLLSDEGSAPAEDPS